MIKRSTPKHIIILTLFRLILNRKIMDKTNIQTIYGPQEIPKWHRLYGKKCYRWGYYERRLVLFSGIVVKIRVQRYYCLETKRTYSLLPFFIIPYQRYINTIIEDVLTKKIIDGQSCDKIERNEPPLRETINRWNQWMLGKLEPMREGLTKLLIEKLPEYFSVDTAKCSDGEKFEDLLSKGRLLASEDDILKYGSLSYIFYSLQ